MAKGNGPLQQSCDPWVDVNSTRGWRSHDISRNVFHMRLIRFEFLAPHFKLTRFENWRREPNQSLLSHKIHRRQQGIEFSSVASICMHFFWLPFLISGCSFTPWRNVDLLGIDWISCMGGQWTEKRWVTLTSCVFLNITAYWVSYFFYLSSKWQLDNRIVFQRCRWDAKELASSTRVSGSIVAWQRLNVSRVEGHFIDWAMVDPISLVNIKHHLHDQSLLPGGSLGVSAEELSVGVQNVRLIFCTTWHDVLLDSVVILSHCNPLWLKHSCVKSLPLSWPPGLIGGWLWHFRSLGCWKRSRALAFAYTARY